MHIPQDPSQLDEKKMAIYDPKSRVAEEFINDQEIRDTLAYAEEHKSDVPLLMSILDKAAQFKGLTHREAAVPAAGGLSPT